jgi:hypothetical protein
VLTGFSQIFQKDAKIENAPAVKDFLCCGRKANDFQQRKSG